jgi:hypothetical protein
VRAFFLFLVLANLGFFAWANFFSEGDTQSDPKPLARQVSADKLRVVPANASGKAAPAPAKAADPAAAAAPPKSVCSEWGAFAAADVAKASEALAPLALGPRLTQRQTEESSSWWVFIPPRGNRQDAQKKAAELKALGIDEYFIVQDEGPTRNSVSLGVFKTEQAATNRLEALKAKGVKTAQVGAREAPTPKVYFQVRPSDDAMIAKLREIAQGFAGSEVKDCMAKPA